mmetsp:Transcript_56919/g.122518  ORF Transcript_56919/g.122518 Transcript_56919/m.122518 type:complete len:85 (+) Transcript_56919:173-427(+)
MVGSITLILKVGFCHLMSFEAAGFYKHASAQMVTTLGCLRQRLMGGAARSVAKTLNPLERFCVALIAMVFVGACDVWYKLPMLS